MYFHSPIEGEVSSPTRLVEPNTTSIVQSESSPPDVPGAPDVPPPLPKVPKLPEVPAPPKPPPTKLNVGAGPVPPKGNA